MKNGKEAATTCKMVGEKGQLSDLYLLTRTVFLEPKYSNSPAKEKVSQLSKRGTERVLYVVN